MRSCSFLTIFFWRHQHTRYHTKQFCKWKGARRSGIYIPLRHVHHVSSVYIRNNLFVTARMHCFAAAGQAFGLWPFPTHSSETPRVYRWQTTVSACFCMPASANRQTGVFPTALRHAVWPQGPKMLQMRLTLGASRQPPQQTWSSVCQL